MSDQFESNGLDSPTHSGGNYFHEISLVESSPKRFSSSSSASSISNFTLAHLPTETSQRELMTAQRQIKDLEKKLGDALAELERIKKDNRDSTELNKVHVRRIKQLEQDSEQLKIVNKSLSNDIETFQAKLTTKDAEYKQLEMKYYEEKKNSQNSEATLVGEAVHKESDHTLIERLQDEVKTLKVDNESMTRYIQKMLNRIMEVDGFEDTLATHWSSNSQKKSSKSTAPTKSAKPVHQESLKTDFKFPQLPPSAKTSDETTEHYTDEPKEYPQQSSPPLTTFESLDKGNVTRKVSPSSKARTGSNSVDYTLTHESPRHVNLPKRSATINVVPTRVANTNSVNSKRLSGLFKWGVTAVATAAMRNSTEVSKEDPYMKPILLVQAKDKTKDWQEG